MMEADETTAETGPSRIDAVLTGLAEAQPREGFEERVLRRLATEPVREPQGTFAGWSWRRPWLVGGLAGVCALGAALTAAVVWHGSVRGIAGAGDGARVAAVPLRGAGEVMGQREAGSGGAEAVASSRARRPDVAARGDVSGAAGEVASHADASAVSRAAGRLDVAAAGAPLHRVEVPQSAAEASARSGMGAAAEASFPAPPMPLTEQERLLLRIAHRNDPVNVAMLDAEERDRVLQRERAETARFFTPVPLPASLQEEVNAALRSQYVNTPPPRELLAATN